MAWKQTLYAFILRRVLGPILSEESKRTLYDSIELSFEEGRFVLQDLDLDPSYVSEKLIDYGIVVEKAFVKKLCINLSIFGSSDTNGSESISNEQSTGYSKLSTMKKIFRLRNLPHNSMALYAEIEFDGVEVYISTSFSEKFHDNQPTSKNSDDDEYSNHHIDEESATNGSTTGYFSSLVDSALASLRLSISFANICLRLLEPDKSNSSNNMDHMTADTNFVDRSWLGLSIDSILYRDLTSVSTEPKSCKKEKLFNKIVELSGVCLQLKSFGTHNDKVLTSTILKTEGIHRIQLQAFKENNFTNCAIQTNKNDVDEQMSDVTFTNDVEISLSERINFEIDLQTIQCIQLLIQSITERNNMASDISKDHSENFENLSSYEGDKKSEINLSKPTDSTIPADYTSANLIMKDYTEARHLARTKEEVLKGGILVPSSNDSNDEDDLDMFFDCNEASFSQYLSYMKSSQSITTGTTGGPNISDQADVFHTTIHVHVEEICMTLFFDKCNSEFTENRTLTPSPQRQYQSDFISIMIINLGMTTSRSKSKEYTTIQLGGFEINDQFYRFETNQYLDSGYLIYFSEEIGKRDENIIIRTPSCISMTLNKILNEPQNSKQSQFIPEERAELEVVLEVIIQPVEVTYRNIALQRLKNLFETVTLKNEKKNIMAQSDSSNTSSNEKSKNIQVSFLCPELFLYIPLNPKNISTNKLETMIYRAGHSITQAPCHEEPMLGMKIVSISIDHAMNKEEYEHNQTVASVTCEHCTWFVICPFTESLEESRISSSKVFEICSFSSDSTFSSDSIIKISLNGSGRSSKKNNFSSNYPIKSCFPLAPPLSSVKARQEESSDTVIRGPDPQVTMLQDAESCSSSISIEIPFISIDLSVREGKIISDMIGSLSNDLHSKDKETCYGHQNNTSKDIRTEATKSIVRCKTGVGISVEQISMSIHGDQQVTQSEKFLEEFTFLLVGDSMKAHIVTGDKGLQNLRFLTQNITLYEGTKSKQKQGGENPPCIRHGKKIRSRGLSGLINASPIFYRSNLAYPLSPETPSLLLDVVKSKDNDYPDDTVIHFSIYDMTHRYALDSKWVQRLSRISHDFKNVAKEEKSVDKPMEEKNETMLKLFVTFSDSVIDYSPLQSFQTKSRIMIRLGEIRLSCNLVPDAPIQAYKASIADVAINVCNHKFPYNIENERLSCSRQVLDFKDFDTSITTGNMSRLRFASVEEVLDHMGFVAVANLDSVYAIIRKVTSICRSDMQNNVAQSDLVVTLTMGQLSLYACKDSFTCLTQTISEYILEITALSQEEIDSYRASANPTFNIDVRNESNLEGKESKEANHQRKEGESPPEYLTLLDVIEDDIFNEKSTDEIESHAISLSFQESDKIEEAVPYADIPDSELSATELRKKHGMTNSNTAISNITESLLIKNFYTINSSSGLNDRSSLSEAITQQGVKHTRISNLNEVEMNNESLGDEDWTTVDLLHSSPKEYNQHGRWLVGKDGNNITAITPEIKIFPHHVPITQTHEDPIFAKKINATKYTGTQKEPRVKLQLIIKDFNANCRFFDGNDWTYSPIDSHTYHKYNDSSSTNANTNEKKEITSRKQSLMDELLENDFSEVEEKCFERFLVNERPSPKMGRQMLKYFQFSFQGVKVRFDSFQESHDHLLASCMRLKVNDFSLIETISDDRPIKMLGEWVNESAHPRDSNDGIIMLKMVSMRPTCKVSVDGKIMSDESVAKLDLLPLRCYIDQFALRFIKGFFSSSNSESEDLSEKMEGFDDDEYDIQVIGTFFKAFNVTNTKLKVNYNPIGVDVGALRDGSYSELLNLFPLEGMELFLQPVQIPNLIGWGAVLSEMSSRWIEDIAASQIHKFIAGATPFHSITNLSEGVADLVLIPVHQYKQRGTKHMGRAVRKGTSKFAGTVAVEALENTSKLTKHIALGLTELAPNTSSNMNNGSTGISFLPSRPETSPRNIGDTVEHAYESLSKGIRAANYTILVVPRREYQAKGTTGAFKSVVKAIPVAVLAPLSGASEAVSYSLLGMRNQLRPDLRKEEEESRRGISIDRR